VLPYSSGTTGFPKGVVISHRAMVANLMQRKLSDTEFDTGRLLYIGVLPFFHIFGMFTFMIAPIARRISVVVLSHFEFVQYLEMIQKYKPTTLQCVPPMVLALAKHPLVKKYDLSSVKDIICAAAPLSKDTEDEVRKNIKGAVFRQGYGMTELPLSVSRNPRDRIKPGSVGILLPNIEAKVLDKDSGKLQSYNQDGELCFRCPNMMTSYFNRPEECIIDEDGFLHTGDIGHFDEEGYLFIVSRIKELIKYKGHQIAPAELEATLLTHPNVLDAAVVGRKESSTNEELPTAFVVLKPNAKVLEKEISDFVAEQVSPYKYLRGGVIFVQNIPKSAQGKIQRVVLRDKLAQLGSKL